MTRTGQGGGNAGHCPVGRLHSVLRTIRDVNRLVVHEKRPDTLAEKVCQLLVQTMGYHSAWIAVLSPEGALVTVAQSGVDDSFTAFAQQMRDGVLPECARAALGAQDVRLVPHPATQCGSCPIHVSYADRVALTAPLSHGDRAYGLMCLSMPASFVADGEEVDIVRDLAADLGYALHAIEIEAQRASALEALEHERDITDALVESSPIAITVVDASGAVVRANAEAGRVLGLSRDVITSRTFDDAAWRIVDYAGNPFPVEQLPVSRALRERCAVYGVEHALQLPTGERILLSVNAAPLTSPDGTISAVVCSIQDVTERHRIETALRNSEHSYRQLFDSMLSGLALHEIILGADGRPVDYRFLEVNPAFERLTGFRAADIVGRTLSEVLPGAEPLWVERYGRVALDGESIEFESESIRLGRHYRVSAYPSEPGRFVTVFEDVTERVAAESRLRESEMKFRALFEQSSEAISVVSLGGIVLDANDAWLSLFHCLREDVPGLNIGEFYADPDGRTAFLSAMERDGVVRDEVWYRRKDGSLFLCERNVIPQKDQNGATVAFQAVVHDVTQLREAARALRESEERFRAVFESSPIGIALVDTSTQRLVQANRSFLDLVGYSSTELTELTLADITHPDDWTREQEAIRGWLRGETAGYALEKRYVRKDGAIRDVIVVGELLRLGSGGAPFAVGSVMDITERKKAEQEVAESRENLRLLARRADEAREDERTTIARELHDRVGQTFTALKFDVDRLRKMLLQPNAGVESLLATMQSLLDEGADDV
ncbi:MAG: PAS domain S-box protein, partial [Dehalococcoidia bacterium]|nr:PAS domain S-box protein [Dehalococcoidia bacterium]